ncbi:hypothetical protein HGM15179_015252 [Zosterops borbonicus]|uniref:Uncharacterized protein n=1 Tax=Zosterops borbonicus TaxID=364589 RepID=A0A8K1LFA1_9PASS|nr:hypothetical protein HGM15179_015252 [Zosterops borbonicus]
MTRNEGRTLVGEQQLGFIKVHVVPPHHQRVCPSEYRSPLCNTLIAGEGQGERAQCGTNQRNGRSDSVHKGQTVEQIKKAKEGITRILPNHSMLYLELSRPRERPQSD